MPETLGSQTAGNQMMLMKQRSLQRLGPRADPLQLITQPIITWQLEQGEAPAAIERGATSGLLQRFRI